MPPTYTYPGVYVRETPGSVRPIAGVSTGTALFIGACDRGPHEDPFLVQSTDEFVGVFGDSPLVGDMARQVRLFFSNGGTTAYAMRIANNATRASVTLLNEGGASVLNLTAANPGRAGEDIRVRVSYTPSNPDATFDVEIFRWEYGPAGRVAAQPEVFTGLSMDPTSSRYAPNVLTQQSTHLDAVLAAGAPAAAAGTSQSGLVIPWQNSATTTLRTQWAALIGTAGPPAIDQTFTISVDDGDPVAVSLDQIDVGSIPAANFANDLTDAISTAIATAHTNVGRPGTSVAVDLPDGPAITDGDAALHGNASFDVTSSLRFSSTATGSIRIVPDGLALASTLRLGLANGGREISPHAGLRPAPNAAIYDESRLDALGALRQNAIASITLDGELVTIPPSSTPTHPIFVPAAGGYDSGLRGGLDGIGERLRVIRDAINDHAAATPTFHWVAELWGVRLAVRRTGGDDNEVLPADFATAPTDVAADFNDNTRFATVGVSGASVGRQTNPLAVASDGDPPQSSDYDNAYVIAERELDLFNLLILPEAVGGADRKTLWSSASIFCRNNRAFLMIDPPGTWTDHRNAVDGTGADDSITDLRTGLVKDHAAVYYPNLIIDEDGRRVITSPAGAVAGLMARIDQQRGVWKAPAGTEADLRDIVGVQHVFSDGENGNLNPRGINTIRRFPTGIVCWGARTMDGDDDSGSEYKYVPVRRLLLFLEESIYRGLQWTVFEPNGFDLWAAIRLNVNAFLNGLFRQGAFAGATTTDSYYVRCGPDTTTPTDQALGIVNVHVGVATLKPAEFVVLSFRQITLPEQ